jgi:mediator of RNA polymerase II transcription subunit 16
MSEASAVPDLTATREGGLLKHLCWSPNGSDLAVYDAAGRVCILSITTSLSRPVMTRPRSMDPIDESHRVVGAHWLNIGGPKPVQVCWESQHRK